MSLLAKAKLELSSFSQHTRLIKIKLNVEAQSLLLLLGFLVVTR